MPEEITKSVPEMLERRAHLIQSNDDAIRKVKKEERGLTDEERADLKDLRDEIERLDKKIDAAQEVEHEEATAKRLTDSLKSGGVRTVPKTKPEDNGARGAFEFDADAQITVRPVYSRLKANWGPGEKGVEAAYRSGMYLRAAFMNDEKARRWCQRNGPPESRALGGNVGSAGGFLVPDEMLQAMIDLRESYGMARQECDIVPMNRDVITIPRRRTGATAAFIGENTAITESDPTFNNVTLTARKAGIVTRVSSELAEDAVINLADYVANDQAYAFAVLEDTVLVDGAGTVAHGGIWGIRPQFIDGTHTAGDVSCGAGIDQMPEVIITDIENLMAALPAYALPGAKFYTSQLGYVMVFQAIASGVGGVTMQEIESTRQLTYLGFPIVRSPAMPASSTTDYSDLVMILFGDMSKAVTLGERRGITMSISDQRYFEQDQIAIRSIERFDINVHDLGDNTTAGPLVALTGVT